MLVVSRSPKNPVLAPTQNRAWESIATFNPSAVREGNTTHLFYRAVARPDALLTPYAGLSTIGHAMCKEDSEIERREQVIMPEEPWERFGCEDPRATFFEGTWYVFYTALGGFPFGPDNIKIAVACGDAPNELSEKHLITPFNAKAAALFPSRIQGEVALLLTAHTDWTEAYPRPTIAIARAKHVEDFFRESYWHDFHEHLGEYALPDLRRKDSDHIEVGAVPIETPQGWLLIYSHIQHYYDESRRLFGIEAVLLDRDDPQKIIGRTEAPFLIPEESYERYGTVPNIVFPSGAVVEGDTLRIYYGAADTTAAEIYLSLSNLLDAMSKEKRLSFVKRVSNEPILSSIPEHPWESKAVFNAASIELEGDVHVLYRAMGEDNTSVLGYARFDDGQTLSERLSDPVYVPRASFELKQGSPTGNSGCEDPRLTQIGDTLYLIYTAYDGAHEPRGAISSISVKDFLEKKFDQFTLPKLLTIEGVTDKDICLFPELVDGKYILIHRIDPNICADFFDDLSFSRLANRCFTLMTPRPGMWDSEKIGAAAPPIKVSEGWLFIYHGIGSDHVYRLGAALLDETGTNIIVRTALPIFEPVLPWEKEGQVGNVVFSCGVTLKDDTLFIYYGGADTAIGIATVSKSALMKKLLSAL
ncbi:MAG: hypothetical protein WAV21_01125 [Minisyncoccia bacterium]